MEVPPKNKTTTYFPQYKTIQDHNLTREATKTWEAKDTAFIDLYLTSSPSSPSSSSTHSPKWQNYKITKQPVPNTPTHEPILLNGYGVSPTHNAYITYCVRLTVAATTSSTDRNTTDRYTEMRYADMILDNYNSAFSFPFSPTSLQLPPSTKLHYLAIKNILNLPSRQTFQQIYNLHNKDIKSPSSIEIKITKPSTFTYHQKQKNKILDNDPFIRGIQSLLRRHPTETAHAFIKRLVFLGEGYQGHDHSGEPSPLELKLNLIVELARGPGEGHEDDDDDDTIIAPASNL